MIFKQLNKINIQNRDLNINATQTWLNMPNDILEIIFSYIPEYKKIGLNKYYYAKYHFLIKKYIHIDIYQNYIFNFINNDYAFVFEKILNENISKWIYWKNYRYKSLNYSSYLYFIYSYIHHKNSLKCKNIFIKCIEDFFYNGNNNKNNNNNALVNAKNWFKNNNIKNVKIQYNG